MIKPSPYLVPDGLFYTKEHEWARVTEGATKVGITDYAAKTLNDIVYLTLPPAGSEVKQLELLRNRRIDQGRLRALRSTLGHGDEHESGANEPPRVDQPVSV